MALITCKECSAQISEYAELCPSCGAPTSVSKEQPAQEEQKQETPYQQATNVSTSANREGVSELPPKSWLVESILVTILCCLPLGIAGIVNASKVESRWYAGDKAGAKRASEEAGRWTKIGFFGGIVIIIVYAILIAVGAVNGIWDNGGYYYY